MSVHQIFVCEWRFLFRRKGDALKRSLSLTNARNIPILTDDKTGVRIG